MKLSCFREALRKLTDSWVCLENKPLEKWVIGVTIIDLIWNTFLLLPTTTAEFLYVNPGGKSGFVGQKWLRYVDIYSYRRFQPWELDADKGILQDPIDWNPERLHIHETRIILDEKCSTYDGARIPGDPGDYLKEVAGHPISSGYNKQLRLLVRLWTAAIFMIYFSTPSLLLATWWTSRRGQIVTGYIIVQAVPMLLFVILCGMASVQKMCALDVIYAQVPIRLCLILFTVFTWIYQLLKFLLLELYVIEMHLKQKRKDYGFKKTRATSKVVPVGGHGEVDVEKVVEQEKKMFNRITSEPEEVHAVTGKALARNILELGDSTEDESTAERLKQHQHEKKLKAKQRIKKLKSGMTVFKLKTRGEKSSGSTSTSQ